MVGSYFTVSQKPAKFNLVTQFIGLCVLQMWLWTATIELKNKAKQHSKSKNPNVSSTTEANHSHVHIPKPLQGGFTQFPDLMPLGRANRNGPS